ncbi:endonuclease/exonuclease/phosphatase family protein [Aquimarina sp. 2-A2]|uniref:endonuclease/exonuclease/phosphatase family protein n=1 Tax=Aquimarina sp. 2-A2 TaxID=3382644 RepID=UPI00387F10FC
MKLKHFLRGFGIIAIILTIFPFVAVDVWWVRSFDFPHLQLTFLTLIAALTYFLAFDIRKIVDYVFVSVLFACFFFQAVKIYPYTTFAAYEVLDTVDNSNLINIYAANVLQDNTETFKVVQDIEQFNADLVVLTETNTFWKNQLNKKLDIDYPYKIEVPLENTYGMILYSKFKLVEPQVHYLIEDTIPSIDTKMVLPSRDTIQIYAIHPAPPVPQHNPSSVDRDAEMMKTARFARNSKYPVIVLGDFNDVAWSETTKLFQRVSGLLDMRKGRGLFNTYNANSYIMKWPLDHVFTDAGFRAKKVAMGNHIGSDHYPFFTTISFEPTIAKEQKLPPATKEELKQAFTEILKEKEQTQEELHD